MGVVYKATDTHLDRFIALKVLPADRVSDPERKRRFVQEAKAASALNHPHIITIYDIAQAEGVDYIAMEYVPGRTLDQLVRGKGLPLGLALKYAVQIADALATAHASGIIHRDLKPANIMVTEKDQVKVLDFGLAKLTERASDDGSGETATAPSTEDGAILGTVAYMSPEQAEGKKLDGRSDIFAFGAVLHEMLSGHRAFQGDSKAATMAAVLRAEPQTPMRAPKEVERIVARCLRKDPERRFQHMDDLKVALEESKEESESGKVEPSERPVERRFFSPTQWVVIAGLLLMVAGAGWWLMRGKKQPPGQAPVLTRLSSDPGLTTEPALSPDGKLVAYASDRAGEGGLDIWLQQVAGGDPVRLSRDPADDREPAFSPDGSQIVFSSEREGGGIYVISTIGGTEKKIASRGNRPRFSPDGAWIAYWAGERAAGIYHTGRVFIVPAAGGTPRAVQPKFQEARYPVWSPDSKKLLFEGMQDRNLDWWVATLDSEVVVPTGAWSALRAQRLAPEQLLTGTQAQLVPVPGQWLEERIVFAAHSGDTRNIWQLRLSPKTFGVAGAAERMTSGTALEGDPSLGPGAASGKSRLVFSSITENDDIWSLPLDPDRAKVLGEPQRLTQDMAPDTRPSISADGQKLVYNSYRSGNWDVLLKDLKTGRETALASTPAHEENPRITSDGAKVAYRIREGGKQNVYLVASSGGLPQKVIEDCTVFPWASDGKSLLCASGAGIFLGDVNSGEKRKVVENGGPAPKLSWDNRWIAFYRTAEPGRTQILIAPMHQDRPASGSELIRVTDRSAWDVLPDFSPDGHLLYFMSQRDGARCLWVQRLDPATKQPLGTPQPVHHFHSARRSPLYVRSGQVAISIARDKVVFTMEERLGNIWMAELEAQ
ncbi:MAG: PD40 domain-containing protein [Acidobacteria bacterium]|nr:PD40 domain-containing protein [Acidobacteriota bacterium]